MSFINKPQLDAKETTSKDTWNYDSLYDSAL